MSHLPTERLAALVDETPTAEELGHLTSCAECARERALYQSLSDLSTSESARIGAPLTTWEALRPALVADGVIDSGRGLQLRARQVRRPWLQAAAAVLLIAGGMIAGRLSARASAFVNGNTKPSIASVPAAVDSTRQYGSVDEALAAKERHMMGFQNATAWLAQRDTAQSSTADKRVRLAAIDQAAEIYSAARAKAPNDPVINASLLTATAQREGTLRQLSATAPSSMRIMSY